MIDFKEELEKYKPIMELDELEDTLNGDELQDMLDMLNYIAKSKEDLAETVDKHLKEIRRRRWE